MTDLMNELCQNESQYDISYTTGVDFTNRENLAALDHRMLDKDIAKLVLTLYDIQSEDRVKEFVQSSDFEVFFSSETNGKKEILAEMQHMEDSGAFGSHFNY